MTRWVAAHCCPDCSNGAVEGVWLMEPCRKYSPYFPESGAVAKALTVCPPNTVLAHHPCHPCHTTPVHCQPSFAAKVSNCSKTTIFCVSWAMWRWAKQTKKNPNQLRSYVPPKGVHRRRPRQNRGWPSRGGRRSSRPPNPTC